MYVTQHLSKKDQFWEDFELPSIVKISQNILRSQNFSKCDPKVYFEILLMLNSRNNNRVSFELITCRSISMC